MRKLLVVALVGWLLTCEENQALPQAVGQIETAPKKLCDKAKRNITADALICQLWDKMGQNKYVIDKVADALEKMGPNAADALAETVGVGFDRAKNAGTEDEKKKALDVAKRAAMILGQIGTEVSGNEKVVCQLAAAAENSAGVPVNEESKEAEALREARRAAIEALGTIFKFPSLRARSTADKAVTAVKAAKDTAKELKAIAEAKDKAVGEVGKAADKAVTLAHEAYKAADTWVESEDYGTDAKAEAQAWKNALDSLQKAAEGAKTAIEKKMPDQLDAAKKLYQATGEKKLNEARGASENREVAIAALVCLLKDSDFVIKILSAEALARIYGKSEK